MAELDVFFTFTYKLLQAESWLIDDGEVVRNDWRDANLDGHAIRYLAMGFNTLIIVNEETEEPIKITPYKAFSLGSDSYALVGTESTDADDDGLFSFEKFGKTWFIARVS